MPATHPLHCLDSLSLHCQRFADSRPSSQWQDELYLALENVLSLWGQGDLNAANQVLEGIERHLELALEHYASAYGEALALSGPALIAHQWMGKAIGNWRRAVAVVANADTLEEAAQGLHFAEIGCRAILVVGYLGDSPRVAAAA